jgi:hypothetical protein
LQIIEGYIFYPPTGRLLSIHFVLRPELKQKIIAPTGPDLLPVLFTQNKYLHNKK